MKWIGVAIMSAIMGVFTAVIAEGAYPTLTEKGFVVVAVIATLTILAIMIRLAVTAGTIAVDPPLESDFPAGRHRA